ncbi:MAG: type III-B CRISPR module RAMP protein Cmr6 [Proteobacteria bacterium]|nr:type III-B CRISPR module RAMP protein Cmr6 [Pseudomonadota bacterium]
MTTDKNVFIPSNVAKALRKSASNFSLYFSRMVAWDEDKDGVKPKQLTIQNMANASKERFHAAKDVLRKIHERQNAVLAAVAQQGGRVFSFRASLASPFVSGLGSGHPTETGMVLDRNTGMPFVPGTSIKGVMRLAHALQLAKKDASLIKPDKKTGKDAIPDDTPSMRRLFGDTDTSSGAVRGQLVFLDAFPEKLPELTMDIMTPHFSKYYGAKDKAKKLEETENPVPIPFLVVPRGTSFVFRCLVSPLQNPSDNDLRWSDDDNDAVTDMFRHGLEELGLGAKTAAGYGRFTGVEDAMAALNKAQRKRDEEAQKAAEEKRLAQLSPDERQQELLKKAFAEPGKYNVSELITKATQNDALSPEFFIWLRARMEEKKLWKEGGNPAKDGKVRRSIAVQKRIDG